MQVPALGQEDPLEEGMTTHSSMLAWRIPWTEEPSGEAAQTPASTISKWGLGREARHGLHRLE